MQQLQGAPDQVVNDRMRLQMQRACMCLLRHRIEYDAYPRCLETSNVGIASPPDFAYFFVLFLFMCRSNFDAWHESKIPQLSPLPSAE